MWTNIWATCTCTVRSGRFRLLDQTLDLKLYTRSFQVKIRLRLYPQMRMNWTSWQDKQRQSLTCLLFLFQLLLYFLESIVQFLVQNCQLMSHDEPAVWSGWFQRSTAHPMSRHCIAAFEVIKDWPTCIFNFQL